jgi:hypothetical protein
LRNQKADVEVSTRTAVSNEKLNRREPARAAGKKREAATTKQGADGQLQGKVWDPGGFQHWRRGAHEQELMIFLAEEYDAGASLQLSKVPASQHIQHTFNGERERRNPLILKFLKFQ